MSGPKKVEFHKILVRNTEQPITKYKVTTTEPQIGSHLKTGKINRKLDPQKVKFNAPELYSILKLNEKIYDIVEPRTKSCSNASEKVLAADEKVARKVNFPYDHPIYKGLIPLTVDQRQSQPAISLRGPLSHKDREPVLSNFVMQRKVPDYYHLPNVKTENNGMLVSSNNLKLYYTLEKR